MASNGIANTPSRSHSADRQGKMGEGGCVGGGVVVVVGGKRTMRVLWMSLVGEPYDACSGGVVGLSLMTWTTLMIRPQAPKCSRPFQLNLLFWGIVPCVSKIDTLGLFHILI
jgi:hypothetical protein